MKLIDRLLKQAKGILAYTLEHLYSDNSDGFIEALGLDPSKYEVALPNGEIRYDDMAALNDCGKLIWE